MNFTLGIFKKEVRNLLFAWRPLGYITNQSKIASNKMVVRKSKDYHFMVATILHSLVAAQKSGGILWRSPYKGTTHEVVLKVPVLCVLGDTEGHDKLCGRFNNWTYKVKCLCRL